MNEQHYVTVSHRSSQNRWGVALKYHNGDVNSLDRIIVEQMFRYENAAKRYAAKIAKPYEAKIFD